MEMETYTTAVFSTAHITEADSNRLAAAIEGYPLPGLPTIHDTLYGYLIYIGTFNEIDQDALKIAGLSDCCVQVLQAAYDKGCRYISLDRDGPTYPTFPTFDW